MHSDYLVLWLFTDVNAYGSEVAPALAAATAKKVKAYLYRIDRFQALFDSKVTGIM